MSAKRMSVKTKQNKKPKAVKRNKEATSSLLPFVFPIILQMGFDFFESSINVKG